MQQAKQEIGAVDGVMAASRAIDPLGFGTGIRFGRTNFDKHQLNDMIDMVESANPEHLETAGKSLWDARDAINDAAEELSGHIGRVDWEGEAATAFRDWANGLVTNAYSLALAAENVGTHITAAGEGLVSVRKSMPPRDDRLVAKSADSFPVVEQLDTNKEYQAALKTEGHRQEAINQMNRLASFYTVSEEGMRGQEMPVFGKMPEMGVPQAEPTRGTPINVTGQGTSSGALGGTARDTGTPSHHAVAAPEGPGAAEHLDSGKKLHDVVTAPDRHMDTDPSQPVGTNIDSVNTLPPDTAKPATPVAPAPSGGAGGHLPPVPIGPIPPTTGIPVGRGGSGGTRGPVVAPPRMAPPASGASRVGGGTGRTPVGPVGRPAVPGQVGARGPVSPVGRAPMGGGPAGKAPASRNIVGGIPRTGGLPADRMRGTGPTGAERTSGVIGGKPTTGPSRGVTGSQVPRGTVIGGENASRIPRAVERPGQRGVIRAPEQRTGGSQASRTPVSSAEGVVGTPNDRTQGSGNGGSASGTGAPGRAPVGNRGSAADRGRKTPGRKKPEARRDIQPGTE
ncbi:hypothetical protein [Streptomyces sp. HUAS TT20]|uniref:hypothetical protein n=1 Tax=Streptomyces sp. HUAS TT20 TaxID=3447509 RepID=UPI0021DA4ABA|nr:hypothetical protein [Streptomyces sp. HUAS 15-9]UXY30292.1 hypothetical protein N8I87_29615 [Streptomyces sp. HUAS 15-9]